MYITLSPSPSVIPLCSLSSFGLRLLQSVRFAAWGIAQSCPFTADLQKKICHCLSQTRTGNSISHKIGNVTTDIRCQCWGGERELQKGAARHCLPLFLLQGGIVTGTTQRKCSCAEGAGCSQCHPVWQGLQSNGKPREVLKGILLMLWLQSWLREKPGPKDLSPAGLGCLGAVPGRLRCPLQRRASSWRSAMLGPHWSVQLALYSCSGLKKTPVLQGARATLPSVELLCAAHCCESSGAAELPATGPGRARLSRGASATHCRVQGTECSYDVWNRVYYSTWSQKEHGYFNDALAIFKKRKADFLILVSRQCNNKCLRGGCLMAFCFLRQNIWDICCFEALNMFCKVIKEMNANHNCVHSKMSNLFKHIFHNSC